MCSKYFQIIILKTIPTDFFPLKKLQEFGYQTTKCFNLYFLKVRTKPYSWKKFNFHHSQEVTEVTALRFPCSAEIFQTAHAQPRTIAALHSWWKPPCLLEQWGLLDLPFTEFWTKHSMDKSIHSGRDCQLPLARCKRLFPEITGSTGEAQRMADSWQNSTAHYLPCIQHAVSQQPSLTAQREAGQVSTHASHKKPNLSWDVAWVVSQEQLNWLTQDLNQKSHLPGALFMYNSNLAENRTKNSLYQQQCKR